MQLTSEFVDTAIATLVVLETITVYDPTGCNTFSALQSCVVGPDTFMAIPLLVTIYGTGEFVIAYSYPYLTLSDLSTIGTVAIVVFPPYCG